MSQVKNLRAMFEQKQDGSPPEKGSDRGRSPAGSAGTATPPPRPLSKVRTNFVAVVEKDGRVGLRRDPSSDSIPTNRSLSQRRLSVNTEEGSASVVSDRTSNMAYTETIPESPRQPEHPATPKANGFGKGFGNGHLLGALSDRPSLNPDKHIDLETPTPKLLPGDPTTDVPSGPPLTPAKNAPTSKLAPTPKAAKATATSQEAAKPTNTKRTIDKPNPVLTKPTSKPPAKSPSLPKTPTNLPKPAAHATPKAQPVKKATEKPAAPKAATSTAAKPAATKNVATAAVKKATPAPVSIPSSGSTGFVKPKPKSPTRPVNLPSSLMAGTASSQSKTRNDSLAPKAALGRSPSRASVSTNGAAPAKTIRRQRSSINAHSRPSLGPPPKKTAQDHPVTKKERDVDEGFLARMARPTVSSASKVSDKAPVTPPRKAPTRADSRSTSTRRPGAASALAVTGSPGSKKKSTSIMGGAQEPAEVSKIEQAEVEEAVRNATVIPEVTEPQLVVEEPEEIKESVPEPVLEAHAPVEAEPAVAEPEVSETAAPGPEITDAPAAPAEPVVEDSTADQFAEEPAVEVAQKEEPAKETAKEPVAIPEDSPTAADEETLSVDESDNKELKMDAAPLADTDSLAAPANGKVIDEPVSNHEETAKVAAVEEEIKVPE
ncbi:hypothetical protein F5X68DRAFT_218289 [Plectosphaerella plurivora]|uniref:Uncharacterized protein n=1 Tax=Plectosphaerella plurivora TaxID=936078 RepID=A0A9P9A640_9PEZI|nr:hypothetical protein F5X68DRAFT_218289 [Plectosphaerella plurivora]